MGNGPRCPATCSENKENMMSELFLLLAVLACPLGMGAMMWFMMKGMGNNQAAPASTSAKGGDPVAEAELELLRHEVDQLRAAQKTTSTGGGTGR